MALKGFEEYVEDRHIRIERLKDELKEMCSELGIPYTLDQRKPDVNEFWITCNLPAWAFGVEEKDNDTDR